MLIAIFLTIALADLSIQETKITKYFEKINQEFTKHNAYSAKLTWESLVNPTENLVEQSTKFLIDHVNWQHRTCARLAALQDRHLLNATQERQTFLLCRGPKYTFSEARQLISLTDFLQSRYSNAEMCFNSNTLKNIPTTNNNEPRFEVSNLLKSSINENLKKDESCLRGEKDFETIMASTKNSDILKIVWQSWHNITGSGILIPYMELVNLENKASIRNGYTDIGQVWREELEMPNIRRLCRDLFESIRPLYTQLHGVVRFYLRMFYGESAISENGMIPAHLLGDLWGHNWELVMDLIVQDNVNLDHSIKRLNWTVNHMLSRVDDIYQSLGFPPLNKQFWKNSVYENDKGKNVRCHGTAANMFADEDFRLLYCAGESMYDFYVLHHEVGHIHYYMAYENQSGIFRQGANSAFHESIGDTIMLGVLAPQHLNRLGLINDSLLYTNSENREKREFYANSSEKDVDKNISKNENLREKVELKTDEVILLKQALRKLPEITFGLALDEYRWELFEGNIKADVTNKRYWEKIIELQGVAPDDARGEEYFDAGAKFHVSDNTPYIRYFLSSFLQHQLFEDLCKAAVFGRRGVKSNLPDSILLHKCDIYGSKTAGKILKDIMAQGSSLHWSEILLRATGKRQIKSDSLLRYYQPLQNLLENLIQKYNIPLGW